MESSPDDPAAVAALTAVGAVLRRGQRGSVLSVDFRPVADKVTDELLIHLAGVPKTRELYLDGAAITDAATRSLLALPALSTLDLQNTAVTDSTVEQLKQLAKLKLLLVTGTQVTRELVRDLRKSMIQTRIIHLDS